MKIITVLLVLIVSWNVAAVHNPIENKSKDIITANKSRVGSVRAHVSNHNKQGHKEGSPASAVHVKHNSTAVNVSHLLIDFVFCWAGEKTQNKAAEGDIVSSKIHNVEGLGFTEMRLALHSLQVNAPWFNKAYLLVNGKQQVPEWASKDPRIQMVDRCSLFPRKRDCPTKNSHACQSVVHLVPGLQEHFVYMEDDIMTLNPITKGHLFAAEGKPYMTATVDLAETRWIYDAGNIVPGEDIPPDHLPFRIDRWSHMPMPLTIAFTKALEKEYPDYFAFVRSHKIPFQCCNDKLYTYGLGEDFTRVWPAMLKVWTAGVEPSRDYEALCWCQASVSTVSACVRNALMISGTITDGPRPGQNTLTIQSCAKAEQYLAARELVLEHLDEYSKPLRDDGKHLVPVMLVSLQRDVPPAVLSFTYTADFALACGACYVIVSTWLSAGQMPVGFLGLTTPLQLAVLISYVFLSVVHMFLQRHAGSTGYSIISATILVYAGKFAVSCGMFSCRADVSEGFSALLAPGCSRCGKLPAFILPMIPGGLLAGYDALSFLSLAGLDPATYQIWVQMRIVVVCILWQLVFQRKLSVTQWLAVVLFTAAGITKGIDTFQVSDVGLHRGIKIVVIQTLMSAIANVSSEVLLKEMPMPADLVNACMYFWGLFWLVIAMLYTKGFGAIYSELLAPAAWTRLYADTYMVGSIVALIALGITCAYLLKELSNIVKELSGGFVIVITSMVQMVSTTMGILGCIMAILGIGVYSTDPLNNVRKDPDLQEDDDRHVYLSPRGLPMKSPRLQHGPSSDFQVVDDCSTDRSTDRSTGRSTDVPDCSTGRSTAFSTDSQGGGDSKPKWGP